MGLDTARIATADMHLVSMWLRDAGFDVIVDDHVPGELSMTCKHLEGGQAWIRFSPEPLGTLPTARTLVLIHPWSDDRQHGNVDRACIESILECLRSHGADIN
jgi:hypothetical protein